MATRLLRNHVVRVVGRDILQVYTLVTILVTVVISNLMDCLASTLVDPVTDDHHNLCVGVLEVHHREELGVSLYERSIVESQELIPSSCSVCGCVNSSHLCIGRTHTLRVTRAAISRIVRVNSDGHTAVTNVVSTTVEEDNVGVTHTIVAETLNEAVTCTVVGSQIVSVGRTSNNSTSPSDVLLESCVAHILIDKLVPISLSSRDNGRIGRDGIERVVTSRQPALESRDRVTDKADASLLNSTCSRTCISGNTRRNGITVSTCNPSTIDSSKFTEQSAIGHLGSCQSLNIGESGSTAITTNLAACQIVAVRERRATISFTPPANTIQTTVVCKRDNIALCIFNISNVEVRVAVIEGRLLNITSNTTVTCVTVSSTEGDTINQSHTICDESIAIYGTVTNATDNTTANTPVVTVLRLNLQRTLEQTVLDLDINASSRRNNLTYKTTNIYISSYIRIASTILDNCLCTQICCSLDNTHETTCIDIACS